jgi:hypothetical protein
MLIVERRALGVFAALGAALSLVIVLDSLADFAAPTEPGSDPVAVMASSRHAYPSPAAAAAFNPPQIGCPRPQVSGECNRDPPAEVGSTTTSKGVQHDRCFRYISL